MQTSANLHWLQENLVITEEKSNAISVSRCSGISARKVHANSALELLSSFPRWSCDYIERKERERERERERKENPTAITRRESCHGEKNETPFLCSVVIFPSLFLLSSWSIIAIDSKKERQFERRREVSEGTGFPLRKAWCVCNVTRTLSPSHTNLHKSINTSA